MVRVLWLVVGSPIECLAPVRRSFAESDHGLVHRGEEMISTQLLQERTVFKSWCTSLDARATATTVPRRSRSRARDRSAWSPV